MNGARFVHDTLELHGWDVEIRDAKKVKGLAPLACKTDRTHATLIAFGHPCPVSDLFGRAGRELLRGLGLPEPWAGTVAASLELIEDLDQRIRGCYWAREVWPGSYVVDEERTAASLMLLHELLAAL
jgi:transposase